MEAPKQPGSCLQRNFCAPLRQRLARFQQKVFGELAVLGAWARLVAFSAVAGAAIGFLCIQVGGEPLVEFRALSWARDRFVPGIRWHSDTHWIASWLLLLLPVGVMWLLSRREPPDSKQPLRARFFENLWPGRLRATLGLVRPLRAPGLLHLYLMTWFSARLVAALPYDADVSTVNTLRTWLERVSHLPKAVWLPSCHPFGQWAFATADSYAALSLLILGLGALWCCLRVAWTPICAAFLTAKCYWKRFSARFSCPTEARVTSVAEHADGPLTSQMNRQKLKAWLQEDGPADEDFFGQPNFAKQLDEFFREQRMRRSLKGLRLVGPYGAGKSTIGAAFANLWARRQGQLFVRIDAWAYADGGDLVEAILAKVQERLAQIDASPKTRALATRFVHASGHARSGWLAFLQTLMPQRRTPSEVLLGLNRTLERLDCWLVLWVDDLDRFLGLAVTSDDGYKRLAPPEEPSPPAATTSATQTSAPRLASNLEYVESRSRSLTDSRSISALLHGLVERERIGLICAFSSDDFKLVDDSQKVFADDRVLPPLEWPQWRQLVNSFRQLVLLPDFVNPADQAPAEYRAVFSRLWDEESHAWQTREYPKLMQSLSSALGACRGVTPRKLKAAFNATLQRLPHISKITDADEVLVLMLLKHLDRDVYDTLLKAFTQWSPTTKLKDEGSTSNLPLGNAVQDLAHHAKWKVLYSWLLEGPGHPTADQPWAYSRSWSSSFFRAAIRRTLDFPSESSVDALTTFTAAVEAALGDPSSPTKAGALVLAAQKPHPAWGSSALVRHLPAYFAERFELAFSSVRSLRTAPDPIPLLVALVELDFEGRKWLINQATYNMATTYHPSSSVIETLNADHNFTRLIGPQLIAASEMKRPRSSALACLRAAPKLRLEASKYFMYLVELLWRTSLTPAQQGQKDAEDARERFVCQSLRDLTELINLDKQRLLWDRTAPLQVFHAVGHLLRGEPNAHAHHPSWFFEQMRDHSAARETFAAFLSELTRHKLPNSAGALLRLVSVVDIDSMVGRVHPVVLDKGWRQKLAALLEGLPIIPDNGTASEGELNPDKPERHELRLSDATLSIVDRLAESYFAAKPEPPIDTTEKHYDEMRRRYEEGR